ncbi:hypothetical protein J7E97_33020 [Streptomyces sp. ISL-66]|uniref:hypothetical protein n=1 Tax=Streptomyces sp. ISL-66 TaxID=2819186 RepID=UPI001BE551BD|nr:hypothetical protein [Streptomyces sp. ISL-66]MBT2472547.1 hypothetical protein [Streptomyces sp. ISL-66]
MRRIGWTAGAALGALLVTGCGPDGGTGGGSSASPSVSASVSASASGQAKPSDPAASAASGTPGAFGREQAAADITAATTATGLPQPEEPATASPSPGQPVTAEGERRAEIFACMAPWQTMEPVEQPESAYAATVAVLEQRGWKIDGKQLQEDGLTQIKLKKEGWVLFARRYDFSGGKGPTTGMPDMLSFFASDLACEGRFTEADMEAALTEG